MAVTAPIPTTYPRGVIVISVQDQTTGSKAMTASTPGQALPVTVGDKLQYIIKITNKGQNVANNELVSTVLSDDLPTNISSASTPNDQQFTATIGTIAPGKTVTKSFAVTVTGGATGDSIKNEACFTGNDKTSSSPQKGCADAYVKVTAQAKAPLPNTGMSLPLTVLITIGSGLVAYAGRLLSFRYKRTPTARS